MFEQEAVLCRLPFNFLFRCCSKLFLNHTVFRLWAPCQQASISFYDIDINASNLTFIVVHTLRSAQIRIKRQKKKKNICKNESWYKFAKLLYACHTDDGSEGAPRTQRTHVKQQFVWCFRNGFMYYVSFYCNCTRLKLRRAAGDIIMATRLPT